MTGKVLGTIVALFVGAGVAGAQVPSDIEAGLRKIGQIVDPACTARLYRPLMPKNDYNTYWPSDAPAAVLLAIPAPAECHEPRSGATVAHQSVRHCGVQSFPLGFLGVSAGLRCRISGQSRPCLAGRTTRRSQSCRLDAIGLRRRGSRLFLCVDDCDLTAPERTAAARIT